MLGNGIHQNGKFFITHSDLHHRNSAIRTTHTHQKFFIFLLIAAIGVGIFFNARETAIFLVASITIVYFLDLLFNLFLIVQSFRNPSEIEVDRDEILSLRNEDLPMYTVFCPLYKEWQVVPQFVRAIDRLDWPKEKLDVQLLLEEDDEKTVEEIGKMTLPPYFRVLLVPHGQPKTKPKACNYGLGYARGEYAVIFDAEDIPDPDQLKKAFIAFRRAEATGDRIICAQAKLGFYNANRNILTRLFSAEYALWFDLVLTGLQSIKSPIPLGGTSNHFRTRDLRMLKGWDPFNVTEDCDLGMRICKLGYHTVIFNSNTMEEATSRLGNWMRQRSRWIKGYMQTYLVHMRRPQEFLMDLRNPHIITFQLVVGGKIASMFINPFMWVATASYFLFRPIVGEAIESVYPGPILYMAVFSLVLGNFLYMYYYMLGCLKRNQGELVKYVLLIPIYWLMMSIAAWKAFFQLIFKPHYWEKTTHGFHLATETAEVHAAQAEELRGQEVFVPDSNYILDFVSDEVIVRSSNTKRKIV